MVALFLLMPLLSVMSSQNNSKNIFLNAIQKYLKNNLAIIDANKQAVFLALIAILVYLIKGIVAIVLIWKQTGLLNKAQTDLSEEIVTTYANSQWLDKRDIDQGSLIHAAISASQNSTITILNSVIALVTDAATFIFLFAAILIINFWVSIGIVAFLFSVSMLYLSFIRATVKKRSFMLQSLSETMNNSLIELSGAIREINVRDTNQVFIDKYAKSNKEYRDQSKLLIALNQSMRYLLEASLFLGVGLVLLASFGLANFSSVKLALGIVLICGVRAIPALNSLFVNVNQIRINKSAFDYITEFQSNFYIHESILAKKSKLSTPALIEGALNFKEVSFQYRDSTEFTLHGISFSFNTGESIGIVGLSGSGKSTLVDLMLGILKPTTGTVSIGDHEMESVGKVWRKSIGYVPQNVFLMNDSIAENIRLGINDFENDDKILLRAVSEAELSELVENLPAGIDTIVGERGTKLSGGERQRIGIARAMYLSPNVLIFDEATSSLDNLTQERFTNTLINLREGKTTIIIAHRLKTVIHCDRILFLENGRVSGLASFDELVKDNKKFSELVKSGNI
jgi:ABC-type multidrug transport system fused ATPase/permease subunit